jgi:hypothetical protein
VRSRRFGRNNNGRVSEEQEDNRAESCHGVCADEAGVNRL